MSFGAMSLLWYFFGRFQMIIPNRWQGPSRPVCIHHGGTGDHVRLCCGLSFICRNDFRLHAFTILVNQLLLGGLYIKIYWRYIGLQQLIFTKEMLFISKMMYQRYLRTCSQRKYSPQRDAREPNENFSQANKSWFTVYACFCLVKKSNDQ